MDKSVVLEAFNALNKYLDDRIAYFDDKVDNITRKIAETKNPFERITLNNELKKAKTNRRLIESFQTELSSFRIVSIDSPYKLPADILSDFNHLASLVHNNSRADIVSSLRMDLSKENYTNRIKDFKDEFEKVISSSEAAGLSSKKVFVDHVEKTIEHILNDLYKNKLKELEDKQISVDIKPSESTIPSDFQEDKFERMILDKEFKLDKNTQQIRLNYGEIKKYRKIKIEAEKIIARVDSLLDKLQKESLASEVSFDKTIASLNAMKNENMKKLEEANRFLSKFDFEHLEENFKEYEKNAKVNNDLQDYENLAYEMEKALQAGNNVKAEEFRQKMLASGEKYSNAEIEKMQQAARHRLHSEKMLDSAIDSAEKKEKERKDSMSAIERFDIEENRNKNDIEKLRSDIDLDYEELVNLAVNDLSLDGINVDPDNVKDKEVIDKKIEEMLSTSMMTPEERAKANDDRNVQYYTDEKYSYMSEVKEINPRYQKNMRAQATNIYREYIKYLANNPDKDSAMKFSEFASLEYGYSNMDLDLVDNEVKGVSR